MAPPKAVKGTATPPPPVVDAPADDSTLKLDAIDTSVIPPAGKAGSGELVQSCNYDRYVQHLTLTGSDGKPTNVDKVLSITPREGARVCGLSFSTHFADEALGNFLVKDLNLPDLLKGPEYSKFTGDLRLHFTPGSGILMFTGFKAGDLTSDTAPNKSGNAGSFYLGMEHYSKDQTGSGFGVADRSAYSLGLGWANLGDSTVGRLTMASESDLLSYHGGNFRVGAQILASETYVNFGGGDAANCKGNFCGVRDFYAPTNFFPLKLSFTYFFNAPSTSEDLDHAPGSQRPITTEELTYKLSSRYYSEIIGQIRRENVAKLHGARLAAGTSFQGVETSRDLYLTAGAGEGVFGLAEGFSRGTNAYELGGLIRNGKWGVIFPEIGILALYGLGAGLSSPLPTPDQYWKGEAGAFGDFRGAAAKMGLITQGSQMGLMALDGLGALGNPEQAGPWFHTSNALLGTLGVLGVWFAKPLSGNGSGEGTLGNSIFRDTAPFFDGRSGTYDPIKENYPWTQQKEYGVHAVGSMLLGYAFTRTLDWASYQLDKAKAYDAGNVPATADRKPEGPSVKGSLSLLPGGGLLSAEGRF